MFNFLHLLNSAPRVLDRHGLDGLAGISVGLYPR